MKPATSILMVDDDSAFRQVMSGELRRLGYEMTTASSGEEALRKIAESDPHVVLLDLRLPGMDGLEVLKKLRETNQSTEVIMLTGHGSIDTAIESIRVGAFDYVLKPCPLDEIEIRIWGRRRLLILERLIPIARSFTWRLMGTGLPSFLTANLGPMRFTLGLSGWSANDWSNTARFDLLEPRRTVSADNLRTVQGKLGQMWVADEAALADASSLDRPTTLSALTLLPQQGRAIYDLDKGVWRHRELTREPLPFDTLRFASPEDEAATALLRSGAVTLRTKDVAADGIRFSGSVTEDGRAIATSARMDFDDRIVEAHCTCAHFRQHKLYKGPCVHMLALRRVFDRDRMVGAAPSVVKGPWGAANNA